jgi:hypothetical protein
MVRAIEQVTGPYAVKYNSVDLGAASSVEVEIEPMIVEIDSTVNGVKTKRQVGTSLDVVVTMQETGGVMTGLAAVFPSLFTVGATTSQIEWDVDNCLSTTGFQLEIDSLCDTTTGQSFIVYDAIPFLEGITIPGDGVREVTVRFSARPNGTGKLYRLGTSA